MTNNKNPSDVDGDQIRNKGWNHDVTRATVLDVLPNRHMVRVNPRDGNAPFIAPVLTPTYGMNVLPDEGERVIVLNITDNVPVVLGGVYLADGTSPPDLSAGEIVIGSGSGASITITNNGDIKLDSAEEGSVYINGVEQ